MKIRVRDFAVALLCVCACFTGSAGAIGAPASSPASGPAPRIDAPLDSLKRSELYDSFNDIHHGHRHEAIDIMRPRGTPILAVADGVIQKLFLSRQGGLTIYEFDSSETYCYYYAHLDGYADDLREGMPVRRGDVIGYVGTSGDAEPTAPQLHFAISRRAVELFRELPASRDFPRAGAPAWRALFHRNRSMLFRIRQ